MLRSIMLEPYTGLSLMKVNAREDPSFTFIGQLRPNLLIGKKGQKIFYSRSFAILRESIAP